MPTVIDPRATQPQQQQQGNDFNAVLSQLNSQRHEVEKQQRQYEAEVISQYAANHGGWANVLNQSGGKDMYKHYATNVLGYNPDVADSSMQAVLQGYNPNEALYKINRELMFTGGQPQPQQEQGTVTQATPPGQQFDPNAVRRNVQEPQKTDTIPIDTGSGNNGDKTDSEDKGRTFQSHRLEGNEGTAFTEILRKVDERTKPLETTPGGKKGYLRDEEEKTPRSYMYDTYGGRSYNQPQEEKEETSVDQEINVEKEYASLYQELRKEGLSSKRSRDGAIQLIKNRYPDTDLSVLGVSNETSGDMLDQQRTEQERLREYRETQQKNIEAVEKKEGEGSVSPVQQQVIEQSHQLASDTLRQNRSLFPGGKIPEYGKMTKQQKNAYDTMQSYFKDVKQGQSLDQIINGARDVFNTVGSDRSKPLSEGKKRASSQQIKNKAMTAARNLRAPETLAEFARMSTDQLRQYRSNIEWMQENDPQRWAETYGAGMQAAQELSNKEYKDALTAGQLIKNSMNKLQLDMQRKALEGDGEAAQMDTMLTLAEAFLKNPELAEMDQYKDASTAIGTFVSNMFASMVGSTEGDVRSILKKLSTKKDGWFGWWGDNKLEASFINPQALDNGSGPTGLSPKGLEVLNQVSPNR